MNTNAAAAAQPADLFEPLSDYPLVDGLTLARITRPSPTAVAAALKEMGKAGLVAHVRHATVHLPAVYRYYLTAPGIAEASAALGYSSVSTYRRSHRMSREWLRIIIGRMDAVASVYAVAGALATGADQSGARVSFHRKGGVEATISLAPDGPTFDVVRQGRALRRQSLRDRLSRIWQYGHHADALLVLTPSPWEAATVERWAEARGVSGQTYVAAEDGESLTGRASRVWQRISSTRGGPRTLGEIVAETRASDMASAGSGRKRASLAGHRKYGGGRADVQPDPAGKSDIRDHRGPAADSEVASCSVARGVRGPAEPGPGPPAAHLGPGRAPWPTAALPLHPVPHRHPLHHRARSRPAHDDPRHLEHSAPGGRPGQ